MTDKFEDIVRASGYKPVVPSTPDRPTSSLGVFILLAWLASGVFSIVLGEWRIVVIAVLVGLFTAVADGWVTQIRKGRK